MDTRVKAYNQPPIERYYRTENCHEQTEMKTVTGAGGNSQEEGKY